MALALLAMTFGAYTVTVGAAARAEAPGTHLLFAATGATLPDGTTVPWVPPLPRSAPVAIAIDSIGVDSPLGEVGLAPDGTLEVPAPGPAYDRPAWYRHSPTPGEAGPAVIEGHLDHPDGRPSVFYRLAELTRGSVIEVRRADGRTATFRVTSVGRHKKAAFPTSAVYGDLNHSGLRLVTCGGPLGRDGTYRDNVVVFAAMS